MYVLSNLSNCWFTTGQYWKSVIDPFVDGQSAISPFLGGKQLLLLGSADGRKPFQFQCDTLWNWWMLHLFLYKKQSSSFAGSSMCSITYSVKFMMGQKICACCALFVLLRNGVSTLSKHTRCKHFVTMNDIWSKRRLFFPRLLPVPTERARGLLLYNKRPKTGALFGLESQ